MPGLNRILLENKTKKKKKSNIDQERSIEKSKWSYFDRNQNLQKRKRKISDKSLLLLILNKESKKKS